MKQYLSQNIRKHTFGHVRSAKIQISLRIRAVWSESSLGAFWMAKDAKFLHVGYEDSNQSAPMRLLWVRWEHISEGIFSDVAVHLCIKNKDFAKGLIRRAIVVYLFVIATLSSRPTSPRAEPSG